MPYANSRASRRALLTAAVSAAAFALPATASAVTFSHTWNDTCSIDRGPGAVTTFPAAVAYTGTLPDSIPSGGPFALTDVRSTLTLTGATVKSLASLGSGVQLRASQMVIEAIPTVNPSRPNVAGTGVTSNRAAFQTEVWDPFNPARTTYRPLSLTLSSPSTPLQSTAPVDGPAPIELHMPATRITGSIAFDGLFGQTSYPVTCAGQRVALWRGSSVGSPPRISTVTPKSGPYAGGTEVTIRGNSLYGATVVFGGTPVTPIRASGTEIVVRSPARAPQPNTIAVPINVTVGSHRLIGDFFYSNDALPAPRITALSPSTGWEFLSTRVTASGSYLAGATAVTFNGQSVPFTVSNGAVAFDAPGLAKGTYTVAITTPGGATTAQFTYRSWF